MLKSLQVKHIKTPNKKRKIESKITDWRKNYHCKNIKLITLHSNASKHFQLDIYVAYAVTNNTVNTGQKKFRNFKEQV